MSIGAGGVISPPHYTKENASGFGSLDPNATNPNEQTGPGPAIWMKYALATGEPIYVLYGHTATSWNDQTTGVGSPMFAFDCTYSVHWSDGDTIGASMVVGRTAPFYLTATPAPHLHISVFKPNKSCNNKHCLPPPNGWGYSQIHLSTGDYINPEEFFSDPQYMLQQSSSLSWNVSFSLDDGGVGTGFFVYDANAAEMLNWGISVSGGNTSSFPHFTYTPADSFAAIGSGDAPMPEIYWTFSTGTGAIGDRQLRFVFLSPLTEAGGTVGLDLSKPFLHTECFNCFPTRNIVSGSVTAVPAQ